MANNPDLVLILRPKTIGLFTSLSSISTIKEYIPSDGDLSIVPEEDCALAKVAVVGNLERVDRAFLSRCKSLKAVVVAAAGFDVVDTTAAGELGVPVCNQPDYAVEEVADTTMAHILCLFRQTTFLERGLRGGVPLGTDSELAACAEGCRRLRGSTLGLIGLGKNGVAVCQRAKAFGMDVAFFDPFIAPGMGKALGGVEQLDTVEDLVKKSDCVSLHCPLTSLNHHLVNDCMLQQFKTGAFLVNTSRGGLVDEAALTRALKERKLAGAALDVFEKEPLMLEESVLCETPNLIITPHSSWYSPQSSKECFSGAVRSTKIALESNNPSDLPFCINQRLLNMSACKARWE